MSWLAGAGPLSTFWRWSGIALLVALALTFAWGSRVDALRGRHLLHLDSAGKAVAAGLGVARVDGAKVAEGVRQITTERDGYLQERNAAKGVIIRQGESIKGLAIETERLKKLSTEQRARIAQLLDQRDDWIRKAQAAATARERMSAEAEAKICEEAADALYRNGF